MTDAERCEKVIRGLECCIVHDPDAKRNCVECPYNHEGIITNAPCANGLMSDALALLKEQEPRVMKFEELRIDSDESVVCWVESASESAVHVTAPYRSMPHICLPFLGTEKITFAVERNYGKKWRCWNIRPSDEQRQNTPWEGENAIPVNPVPEGWFDLKNPVIAYEKTITGGKSVLDVTFGNYENEEHSVGGIKR